MCFKQKKYDLSAISLSNVKYKKCYQDCDLIPLLKENSKNRSIVFLWYNP